MKAKQNYVTGLEKAFTFKYKSGKRNYFFAEVSNRKNIHSTNSPQINRNIFYFIRTSISNSWQIFYSTNISIYMACGG